MAHKIYDNFYLSNEVEDQFNSHLDLQQFCTVDNSLVGTAGMIRKINVYKATNGTEKLGMGEGNTKSIEVSYTPEEYKILMAQNKFEYYDEQEMTDPMLVPVGTRHMGTDMFNTVNGDVYGEFKKATMVVPTAKIDFAAFVDAVANLNIESTDNQPEKVAPQTFAFINGADTAELRKNLAEDLKYVEAFARAGYIGTVGGVNIYTKEACRKCWAKFYCSGGCAANAYHCHGDINKPYETGCELQRKRVECAIMLKAAEAYDERN